MQISRYSVYTFIGYLDIVYGLTIGPKYKPAVSTL